MGLHHYPDIQSIQDDFIRVPVERACLQLGQQLLLLRAAYTSSSNGSSSSSGAAEAAVSEEHGKQRCSRGGLSIEQVQQLVREACGGWLP